ncbi:MAG: DUF3450 family protein [Opitutae bacterium]|nr:DUF3450 family protein [Opitutae bacterium]
MNLLHIPIFSTLLILSTFKMSLFGEKLIDETRTTIEQWVETEQIISKEKSEWDIEKGLLEKTYALLSSEVERLNSELDDLKESASASDEERSTLAAEKESLKAAAKVVSSSIGSLEIQLKAIIPSLPEPLIQKIRPLIRRLPDDPNKTDLSLGQRVQNIVGILSQTDKFNGTITSTSEAREFEAGKMVQVTTLYIGLASAYYVDDSGKYAGVGIPTSNGWEWPVVEGIGSDIQQLVEIYQGTGEIQFINAPAQIKTL